MNSAQQAPKPDPENLSSEPLSKLEFANFLRGVAATIVVCAHLFGTYWGNGPVIEWLTGIPYQETQQSWFIATVASTFAPLVSFGVGLFFVISGFVIPFSLARYTRRGFIIGRIIRIWPTYWAGLSCTLVAIWLGSVFLNGNPSLKAKDILFHYFPPMRAVANTRWIDAISWTLEIEIMFYIICIIFATLLKNGSRISVLIPFLLFSIWLPIDIYCRKYGSDVNELTSRLAIVDNYMPYIIFMLSGTALNLLQRKFISAREAAIGVAICVSLFAVAQTYGSFIAKSPPASYGIALIVFVLCMTKQAMFERFRQLRFLSDISYPLYVCHGVVGYVVLQGLTDAGVNSNLAVAAAFSIAILLAWMIHAFVEKPSHEFGQRLARRL